MPTQNRKLARLHWQTYLTQGGKRPVAPIFVDWVGPAMLLAAGSWSVNEEVSWEGPDMDLDAGAFSVSESVSYEGPDLAMDAGTFTSRVEVSFSGPDMALDAGVFTVTQSASYAGPDLALDGGTFSVSETVSFAGPDLEMMAGTWSVNEEVSWEGPAMALDGGTFSFSRAVDYVGPDLALEGGTWFASEVLSWSGPDMALDAGEWSVSEAVSWSGPDVALDGGTFTALERVDFAGPDLELDGGAFTSTEIARVWGPELLMYAGDYTSTELFAWSGPDVAMDAGTWTAAEAALWAGPDLELDAGTFTSTHAAGYAGPDVALDAGTWTSLQAYSYAGPDMALDAGTFTASAGHAWEGPDLAFDGGTFTAFESVDFAGPELALDPGYWTANEDVDWPGPAMDLEAGTFSFSRAVDYTGPDLALDGGTFSVSEAVSYAGGELELDGGTFTVAESISWQGPDMALDAGSWSANEVAAWSGPDLALDAGTFTVAESYGYAGPDLELDGGTFTASESVSYAGPDLSLEAGTFTASQSYAFAGPDLELDGGTFTVAEDVSYTGAELELDAGTWTAALVAVWSGPDMQLDGGTFNVDEGVAYSGPDMALDGGTFTVSESVGYSGPDMAFDAGTFTAAEAVLWAGPDMALDGGTFTVSTAVDYAGPDMALDAGTFTVTEDVSYAGPDMALDGGTWTAAGVVTADYTGPDMALDGGTWSVTKAQNIVTDGVIYAFAADATGGYVAGGDFTRAYLSPNGRGGGDILAISDAARSLLAHVNGPINAIASDGAGGVYIGGDFSQVGGVARQRLARVLSNGTLSSFDPGCDGVVHALLYSTLATNGAVLYVGGRFNVCGGLTRYNLAQISATTGAAVSTWSAHAAVSGSYTAATVFCLSPGRSTSNVETSALRFGGYFDTVAVPGSTLTRQSMCQLADGTSPTISGAVNLTKSGGLGTCYALYTYRRSQNNDVYAVIGGDFTAVNGTTRSNVALWNSSTGTLAALYPGLSGANLPVRSITGNHTAGHVIYFGGDFTTFGGLARNRVAGWNSNNNTSPYTPTSFNPSASATVRALALDGSFLYVAGDFTTFGGRAAKRIGKINTGATTTAEDWNTTLDVFGASVKAVVAGTIFGATNVVAGGDDMTTDFVERGGLLNITGEGTFGNISSAVTGTVYALHRHADDVYVGGQFSAVGGVTGYKGLAKLDIPNGTLETGWKPSSVDTSPTFRALAYHNSAVFAGGSEVKKADASTGAIDGAWVPTVSGTVNAFHLHGGKLVIGDDGLRAVDLTTGAAATWADSTPTDAYALARVDDTLYAVGVFGIRRYAFDTGVYDTGWTPVAITGASRSVVANGQHIYVGANAAPFAWRLNADGTNDNLVTGFNGDVLALLILSDNFVLFGGSMTASTLTTRLVESMGYVLEA